MITNPDSTIRIRTSPRASYSVQAIGNGVITVRQASGKARHITMAEAGKGRYYRIASMVLAARRRTRPAVSRLVAEALAA
jgi:hypothetical protein